MCRADAVPVAFYGDAPSQNFLQKLQTPDGSDGLAVPAPEVVAVRIWYIYM